MKLSIYDGNNIMSMFGSDQTGFYGFEWSVRRCDTLFIDFFPELLIDITRLPSDGVKV